MTSSLGTSTQQSPSRPLRALTTPEPLLAEIQAAVRPFLLIGAHARDLVCVDVAQPDREMPRTTDIDNAEAATRATH